MDKEAFERLSQSIIMQAVRDYYNAFTALKKDKNNKAAQSNLNEVKHFFNTRWYKCLTSIPGEFLIQQIENQENFRRFKVYDPSNPY